MSVDLQPVVLAVAGLILACTPVAVAYLTVQVEMIKQNLHRQDAALAQHRADTVARLTTIEQAANQAASAATVAASHTERRAT